ncbi:MAG: hypothetical protein AMXMBFR64_42070 [Myxococcales bacterium]
MRRMTLVALGAALSVLACDPPEESAGSTGAGAGDTGPATSDDAVTPDAGSQAPDVAEPAVEAPDAGDPGLEPEDVAAATEDVGPVVEDASPAGGHPEDVWFDPYNDPNVECPPSGATGPKIGDVLPNVKLKTCDGTPFYIHELCGAQAYWIFQTAGWCPYCAATAKTLKDIPQEYFDKGGRIIVNVLRDQNDKVANTTYCQGYAKSFKIPEDRIILAVDPTQTTKKFNQTGGVPFHVVMDREMRIRFMWSGGATSSTALSYMKILFKEQAKADGRAD